jgi:DNA-directed RNA polymerase subunit N (RpoN/RPB10)
MIIPHFCFTCGKPISNRWEEYIHMVNDLKKKDAGTQDDGTQDAGTQDAGTQDYGGKSIEGHVLTLLGMDRYCCKRMFLCQPTHLVNMLKNRKVI